MSKKYVINLIIGVTTMSLLCGCDFGDNPVSNHGQSDKSVGKIIVAVTTAIDWSSGNVSVYSVENDTVKQSVMKQSFHSDNNIRIFDTSVYLIERMGKDNVSMVNGHHITTGTVDNQVHISTGINIHDIVFVNSLKAYITIYGGQDLICYNPGTGEVTGKKISLGLYTPSGATTPKMSEAICYSNKAFIGMQMYSDDFKSFLDTGALAVINTVNDSVEKKVVLKKNNPQGMCTHNGILYCACIGDYGIMDGGIVSVDLVTESVIKSVEENVLGGDVSDVLIISESKGYAIVSDINYTNTLVTFNPATGEKITVITAGGTPSDFLFDDGKLYIASRAFSAHGIIVLDTNTDTVISGPHALGLPPNKIAMLNLGE